MNAKIFRLFATRILLMGCAILVALLAGCGGGGDSPCTPKTVHVQLFGDSTMVNMDAWTKNAAGVPALQRTMDARFGVGAVVIENRAVPGTSSQNLVDGSDGLNRPWPGSLNADIIVVNHGMNDVGRTTLVTYQTNLSTFAAAGVSVLFMTPNDSTANVVAPYAVAMREVAQGRPVADVFAYIAAQPAWPTLLLSDGTHPLPATEEAIVRDVVAPVLIPMVVKAQGCGS